MVKYRTGQVTGGNKWREEQPSKIQRNPQQTGTRWYPETWLWDFRDTTIRKRWYPAKSSPIQLSNIYKSIINIWHMLYQIATNKKHGFPQNVARDRYDKILKLLKIQLFLKRSNQIREHGWLCKWNHKQAYRCLPISNSFCESTKPQVEFWSKESKNRQTDGQPGLVTWETEGHQTQDFINVTFVLY